MSIDKCFKKSQVTCIITVHTIFYCIILLAPGSCRLNIPGFDYSRVVLKVRDMMSFIIAEAWIWIVPWGWHARKKLLAMEWTQFISQHLYLNIASMFSACQVWNFMKGSLNFQFYFTSFYKKLTCSCGMCPCKICEDLWSVAVAKLEADECAQASTWNHHQKCLYLRDTIRVCSEKLSHSFGEYH